MQNYDVTNTPEATGAVLTNPPEPVRMYGDRTPRPIRPTPYTGLLTPRQHIELLRGPDPRGSVFADDDTRRRAWDDHAGRIAVEGCWASRTYDT